MKKLAIKKERQIKRVKRTRMKLIGKTRLTNKPRLSVYRSNKYFYAQIIDDRKGTTLLSVNIKEIEDKKLTKVNQAVELGKIIAKKAKEKGIKDVIFDKGSYRYHGRVKIFADSAREGGLNF